MTAPRGPVPKRSEERRRRNASEIEIDKPSNEHTPLVEWPVADAAWHDIATMWYNSLPASPQSQYMTHSDVAEAWYIATIMSQTLTADKMNSMLVAVVMQGMTDLMTSEASRRRLRVEIARQNVAPQATSGDQKITDIRTRLRKA